MPDRRQVIENIFILPEIGQSESLYLQRWQTFSKTGAMIYKILYHRYILLATMSIFFPGSVVQAQNVPINHYGIGVVQDFKQYHELAMQDSLQQMKELQAFIPGITYDLRYATVNNFMHRRMYPPHTKHTFLRLPAAGALKKVQGELNKKGYALKIFDAYRPYSVTEKFWELVKDERYVANPAKGSGHNRGLSVDCTIIDAATGRELDMGTGFDNFTDSAHHSFVQLPRDVLEHRSLLKGIMQQNGFTPMETEWWHYSWPNDHHYEVLDLSFKDLYRGRQFKH